MKNRPFPEAIRWCYFNWRNYKQAKRQEARRLSDAIAEFNGGCAYIPRSAYLRCNRIRQDIAELRQELSVKEWGR